MSKNNSAGGRLSDADQTLEQMYKIGLELCRNVCSIVTMPIEFAIRPFFGTRYFNPIHAVFSWIIMLALPFAGTVGSRFGHSPGTTGLIGMGTISFLFFAAHAIHGPRTWRRMLQMWREDVSRFENEALPFFSYLPYGNNFWLVRIVHEPALVMLTTLTLSLSHVLTHGAGVYFAVVAVALSFKGFIGWYLAWNEIRDHMDARYIGPLMARVATGRATETEAAKVHLAGFPKNIPPEVKHAVVQARIDKLPDEVASLLSPVQAPDKAA
jgi:hypothetical protein